MALIDQLHHIKTRFDEVADLIIQPDIITDQKRYVKLNKEYKDLEVVVEAYHKYKTLLENVEEANEIIA